MQPVTDTMGRVAPAMELVYESGTPELRAAWASIKEQLVLAHPRAAGDWPFPYLSLAPEANRLWVRDPWHESPSPEAAHGVPPAVLHDNPLGRLQAMDAAGVDRQLISPGPTIDACIDLPTPMAGGVFGAYNEYVLDYCSVAPDRLKAVLQVQGAEPSWTAREIHDRADDPAVAAVSICMPVKIAPDARNFQPIWEALEATGLPVLHRSSFCARVWSPQRLVAYLHLTGVLERYPRVRFAFVDSEPGWLAETIEKLGQETALAAGIGPERIFAAVGEAQASTWLQERGVPRGCLLWESNFPLNGDLARSAQELQRLSDEDRRALTMENPARLLDRNDVP